MAEEQYMIFQTGFLDNVSSPDELAELYPFIKARESATLTVRDGVLVKQGRAGGDELFPGEEGVSDITYNIAIACDKNRYNVGLGCYVASLDGQYNRFCFHPGMGGGQFRIEGTGGHGNMNIGFTPPQFEEGEGGCIFTVELKKTGQHKVTITHPGGPERGTVTSEWTNSTLWMEDRSPSFGIHAGDIFGSGHVFYENFSISSASSIPVVLNVHAERLDTCSIKLTFTNFSGGVVSTKEVSLVSTAKELMSALQPEFPNVRLALVFPDGTTINSKSAALTMESLAQ